MTRIHFVLCSLAKSNVVAWNWWSVCFDNIAAPRITAPRRYSCISGRRTTDGDRRHISTEHSVSFFIYGNGYPGDSIPAVAVATQQQKQPCCQSERGRWFTVTSNRFGLCIVSLRLMIGPAFGGYSSVVLTYIRLTSYIESNSSAFLQCM